MKQQDFTKKCAIIVNCSVEPWQVTNTVGHIAAYLGNKMTEPFDTGKFFTSQDGVNYPRNLQYPIIVHAAKPGRMPALAQHVRESGLLHMVFIKEMIETTDDAEIEQLLHNKPSEAIEIFGVGIFGQNNNVEKLTKKYSLWK